MFLLVEEVRFLISSFMVVDIYCCSRISLIDQLVHLTHRKVCVHA